MPNNQSMVTSYKALLISQVEALDEKCLQKIFDIILQCWKDGRTLFICGNGGSAANSVHLANDYLYGIGNGEKPGMRVVGLPANEAVMTCLANDVGYDSVFSSQLNALASEGDVLMVLSGSGNSPNVVKAIEKSKDLNMQSIALLGFSGGHCKSIADLVLHFDIDDMQIAEDMQLVVGHMIMKHLFANRTSIN